MARRYYKKRRTYKKKRSFKSYKRWKKPTIRKRIKAATSKYTNKQRGVSTIIRRTVKHNDDIITQDQNSYFNKFFSLSDIYDEEPMQQLYSEYRILKVTCRWEPNYDSYNFQANYDVSLQAATLTHPGFVYIAIDKDPQVSGVNSANFASETQAMNFPGVRIWNLATAKKPISISFSPVPQQPIVESELGVNTIYRRIPTKKAPWIAVDKPLIRHYGLKILTTAVAPSRVQHWHAYYTYTIELRGSGVNTTAPGI